MPPYQGGGDMIKSVTFEKTIYNDLPHKFEAGTPNIAGGIGLGAAIDYMNADRPDAVAAFEHELLVYATEALHQDPAATHHRNGKGESGGALVRDRRRSIPHDIGTILDHEGIAIRTGHHCAQPVMQRFGRPGDGPGIVCVLQHERGGRHRSSKRLHKVIEVLRLMSSLRDLYQEVILDHNKSPRNFRVMEDPTRIVEGYNPLCGDHYTVFVKVLKGKYQGRELHRGRMRDLEGVRLGHELAAEREDGRRSGSAVYRSFHRLVTGEESDEGSTAGETRGLCGRE